MTDAWQAELPKQYDHHGAQERWYSFWKSKGYFHAEVDSDREPFTIVMPPPNVTGALHLGHALNNTLQDILIRLKRMQGYNALWMPGTDHAGIATQAVVERRLIEQEGKTRHDLGREELVRRIWKWKEEYAERILKQLGEMGCSCDWDRTRFTLDEICARAVRQTFYDLFKKQVVYRGKRLVNWDTYLQTAVSDDEVFHQTVDGHFWHIRYKVVEPQEGEPEWISLATTRPETLLGDTAVAVHPEPAEAIERLEADLKIKRKEALPKDIEAIDLELEQLAHRRESILPGLIKISQMARDGRRLCLPLLERQIPLVTDEWAKPNLGSGCVKITPAHDPNDYQVGLRQSLPMINILNPDGTLNAQAGPYEGLTIRESRKKVVADLENDQLLEHVEDRQIDLAHSDRSKTPIEPYLADQWFISMDILSQSSMDAVRDGRVQIIPQRYEKGYLDWLSEKRDWPVSRQLWWGHRIPVWSFTPGNVEQLTKIKSILETDSATKEDQLYFLLAEEKIESGKPPTVHVCLRDDDAEIAKRLEDLGFHQDPDVLDTWFSSALWPHSTLGWPEETAELDYFYPTNVLVTSRDIITLWVARMILASLFNTEKVPFHEVYIHPKILDGYGETMSKSKGNGVDPLDVINLYGADALRFGIAYLATENQDARMKVEFICPHCNGLVEQTKKNRVLPVIECTKCKSPFSTQWAREEADCAHPRAPVTSERFELGRNFCNKLWNAARFSMLNLQDYSPGDITVDDLELEDRWILSRLATVTQNVTDALEHYRYADVARILYDFAWDEFCSFYIEIIKVRLTDSQKSVLARRVLAHTLDTLIRLLHPIVPFITEEVWQRLAAVAPKRGLKAIDATESVMVASWPEADDALRDEEIETRFSYFQKVLAGVREIRSRQQIAPRKQVSFSVRCDAQASEALAAMKPYFDSMAAAVVMDLGPQVEAPLFSATANTEGMQVFVDMEDLIDVAAEITRNENELTRLQKAIAGKEKKLGNQSFVSKAPVEVVAREKESLQKLQLEVDFHTSTLAKLKAL
ncbi:MAG: valine--tRNA ligase [Planctomycetales bacterium]